ncbi:MAG: elongation factor G [Clostridia bacterium]|nr:elongation factor G [Clostridia bacterium]
MKDFTADKIKNIALIGHGSSGKTTLADALLYSAGLIERVGSIADGNTTLDFDAEEKKRKISISTACYQLQYKESKLNIIDTPGLFDFAAGVSEGLTAADMALVVLSGKSGLSAGAKINFALARKNHLPCAFFIGKLNSTHAYFYRVLSTLTANYGGIICPVTVPHVVGEQVECFVNLITNKAYKYNGITATEVPLPDDADITNVRNILLENIASVDEALMEKYFEGESFSEEEMVAALQKGMLSGELCPVFAGINATGEGVPMLLEILEKIAPSAAQHSYVFENEGERRDITCGEGKTKAVVFKTIADPFVGKLSYFKVISGAVKNDMRLVNSRTGVEEKIAKVMMLRGGKQEDAGLVSAGDIGAVAKLGSVLTGDTLCDASERGFIHCFEFPSPSISMAVYPKNKGDEEKISQSLNRLMEEDPSISYITNVETKEQVLSGLGEQHLDVLASKLKNKFGVEMELRVAKVPYRETIRKSVKVQGRHKKQSGGHGQFGDVWIEFSPAESDEIVFEEKIFGGAVPKNFFPAVEKGIRESAQRGVLAGYPMVGVKATLVDGSYHPVDSSEMSFKMAANLAYKEGIPQAGPVLLEPVGTLKVDIPDDIMGDVIGDINKRRGRVLGMNPLADRRQEVVAEVPMAEMSDFSTALRSISQGRAGFTFVFERYEEAPPQIAAKVIEKANA